MPTEPRVRIVQYPSCLDESNPARKYHTIEVQSAKAWHSIRACAEEAEAVRLADYIDQAIKAAVLEVQRKS